MTTGRLAVSVLVTALLITLVSPTSAQTNLIQNGGFEEGYLDGWLWAFGVVLVNDPHSGNHSMMLAASGFPSSTYALQYVTLDESTSGAVLSLWISPRVRSGAAILSVYMLIENGVAVVSREYLLSDSDSSAWQKLTFAGLNIPAGSRVMLEFAWWTTPGETSDGDILIDDVSLDPNGIGAPTPTPTLIGHHSLVLQNGVNEYSGTSDTWINGWSSDTNYGADETIRVRSGG